MGDINRDLESISERLMSYYKQGDDPKIREPLNSLEKAGKQVALSSSRSWLGYHSRIYYKDFARPPAGARFSPESGLTHTAFIPGTVGDWIEYDFDAVVGVIHEMAGNPELEQAEALVALIDDEIDTARTELLSILEASLQSTDDAFLERMRESVESIKLADEAEFIEYVRPKGQFITTDRVALSQGHQIPPHYSVLVKIAAIAQNIGICKDLAKLSTQIGKHISRRSSSMDYGLNLGTKVFIGHGRSPIWKDLKDFISDRLQLNWDEFNRIPVAGITNISRLSQMLDDASIALIILTAEDEQADGSMRARLNVIHEAGLFQGKLGFTRAIILLEEDCEEFSNIEGLGQIRFPQGNISSVFEDVRLVLEREGLLKTGR